MRRRHHRTARTLVLLAIAILCFRSSWAQSVAAQYVGRSVEDVQLLVENKPTVDTTVLDLIEVRRGDALSAAAVRESIAHVFSLGRFQDVQVEAAPGAAGGVVLRINLIPFHTIQKIVFAGTLGLSSGELRSTVADRYGASPPIGRVDAAVRTLQQLYLDNGYLRATVNASTEIRHDPDLAVLTFTIDAGPRATIGRVTIEGDPLIAREEFLRRIGAETGQLFLRPRIQERLDAYVKRLKERRYYEAEALLQFVPSDDGRTVDLDVGIRAGLPVTVRFEGDAVPADRLKELAPIDRDGSIDEDLLEDSEARLENYLRQEGYWKADVNVRREPTERALTIVFNVNRGRQYRVASATEINGMQAIPASDITVLVPLKAGDLFKESALSAEVAAIQELYRQRGFAAVSVRSAINETDPPKGALEASAGSGFVRAAIVIAEGPRSELGEIRLSGASAIPADELRPLIKLATGDPYFEPRVVEARDGVALEYLNRGYASAKVDVTLRPNQDRTRIDLDFVVQEGPQSIVDHVLIVGNAHTKPEVILRELQFQPGQPIGLQDQFESRRRLSALGLFRRVQVTVLTHGSGNEHDVLVTVEEAPATTIGYGGGIEGFTIAKTGDDGQAEDTFEVAPRGFFDITRRNLFGANRSVSLYTRASLRSNDSPDDPTQDGDGIGFNEYRFVGTYLQPQWFGGNSLSVSGVVERGVRTTYNFKRRGVNVDVVRRLNAAYRVSGRYSLSSTSTFDERLSEEDQATIDRLFPQVRLSGFSGAIARDTRDDLLDPTRGGFLSAESSLAARALGGQVGFAKTYMQGFTFHRLPGKTPVIFASRVAIGLADGFEREVQPTDADGNPIGPPVVVDDLPSSERFFAGGDTTIRGFALDRVGAPNTISPNGFPTGGNAVLLLNGELRFPVWRSVGAVAFVDGGNVFRRVTEFDIGELRGSYGFGLRYRSPIGPIRVDLGVKMDRRVIAGVLEPPVAWHFSLGQAF